MYVRHSVWKFLHFFYLSKHKMQTSQQRGDSKPGEYQKKKRFSAWHFYDGALTDQPSRAARRNSKQTSIQNSVWHQTNRNEGQYCKIIAV
jgi:hypothetical protein